MQERFFFLSADGLIEKFYILYYLTPDVDWGDMLDFVSMRGFLLRLGWLRLRLISSKQVETKCERVRRLSIHAGSLYSCSLLQL